MKKCFCYLNCNYQLYENKTGFEPAVVAERSIVWRNSCQMCLAATLLLQSHTHFTTTNMNGHFNNQHECRSQRRKWIAHNYKDECIFVMQPPMYWCFALDTCGAKSFLLLFGLLDIFTIKPFTILEFYSSALVQYWGK